MQTSKTLVSQPYLKKKTKNEKKMFRKFLHLFYTFFNNNNNIFCKWYIKILQNGKVISQILSGEKTNLPSKNIPSSSGKLSQLVAAEVVGAHCSFSDISHNLKKMI